MFLAAPAGNARDRRRTRRALARGVLRDRVQWANDGQDFFVSLDGLHFYLCDLTLHISRRFRNA